MKFKVSGELKEFIESPVAVLVGTGDDDGHPHGAYGWGPRVSARGDGVEVFLDTARADPLLADLRANGRIAMTVADPITYRSVQLKGRFRKAGPPTDEDRAWVEAKRHGFVAIVSLIGDDPVALRNLWLEDVVRVSFAPDAAFDQTPGPGAGRPL